MSGYHGIEGTHQVPLVAVRLCTTAFLRAMSVSSKKHSCRVRLLTFLLLQLYLGSPIMAGSYNAVYIDAVQGDPAAFGEPLTLAYNITNQSSSPLPKQTLKIHPCSLESYWEPSFVQVPELCAHSTEQVHMKAFCQQTANAEDIPGQITVQLEPYGVQTTFRLRFQNFTGGLTKLSPAGLQGSLGVDKFNILLFGLAGAGKSSFINSVHTLLSSGKALMLMSKWLLSPPVRLQAVR